MLFSRICIIYEPFLTSNISGSQSFEAFILFLKKIISLQYDGHIPIQKKRSRYLREKNVDTKTIYPILNP